MSEFKLSRRKLLGSATLAGLAPVLSSKAMAAHHPKDAKATLKKGGVMLFQGDSITDAGRDKKDPKPNEQKSFGKGYAWMAASQLLISNPAHKLTLHNRGISGNKVHQLAARWDDDCLDLIGTEEQFGKTLRTDLEKGKLTLPILYLLEGAAPAQREKLQRRIIEQEALDLPVLVGIADYEGAIERALDFGSELVRNAMEDLRLLDDSPYRDALEGVSGYLLGLLGQLQR